MKFILLETYFREKDSALLQNVFFFKLLIVNF